MSDEHSAPKIDPRTADDITAQTEAMVTSLLEGAWRPAEGDDGDDPLGALIKIFGALTSHAVDRINAVPNAAFDSYLKLIGIRPQPPAPARVPLTFSLVKDSPEDAVVPAGTQVGATADPDDANTDEIVFETEDELIVSRASLIGAFSYDPARDHLDDVTDAGTGWIESRRIPRRRS